eukprot:gene27532-34264_t
MGERGFLEYFGAAAPIVKFLVETEKHVQRLLLPAVPRSFHYLAPPYTYPESDRVLEYIS